MSLYTSSRSPSGLTLHIKEPIGDHKYSFIWLHGYDCDGKSDLLHRESWSFNNKIEYSNLRVICPDAIILHTSAPGYSPAMSWYDFKNGDCNGPDDEPDISTLKYSCSAIHEIINSEVKRVGINNIFLGGNSQGGCCALHAAATAPYHLSKIGGLYVSIAHVMPVTPIENLKEINGPIVFYNGLLDTVYDFSWVKETISRLKDLNIEIVVENVGHVDDGHWLGCHFLPRVLGPPPVLEQLKVI